MDRKEAGKAGAASVMTVVVVVEGSLSCYSESVGVNTHTHTFLYWLIRTSVFENSHSLLLLFVNATPH